MAKVEPVYHTEVFYLNNSPHHVRIYAVNEAGEKVFHSEKKYPPVTGNMPDDQAAVLWDKENFPDGLATKGIQKILKKMKAENELRA